MPRLFLCFLALLLLVAGPAAALEPIRDEVNPELLRSQSRRLAQALAPLRPAVGKELTAILDDRALDADKIVVRIQELLDRHCLVGIHINPESRVKAARGPAAAELTTGANYLLVKVHNEAGVTHALTVDGPQLRSKQETGSDRWLEAAVLMDKPLTRTLNVETIEYRILRLLPHETGKREATLRFDVGQGTQDLGFRAEVPVLFTIR
jgi:hypothetical protein